MKEEFKHEEFDILQLEKFGVLFELLGDITLIKAIDEEEKELYNDKNEKHKNKHLHITDPIQLRVAARELYTVGRLLLAIAISKDFRLNQETAKDINDIKKLGAKHKSVLGEWIIFIGTILTLSGVRELEELDKGEEKEGEYF